MANTRTVNGIRLCQTIFKQRYKNRQRHKSSDLQRRSKNYVDTKEVNKATQRPRERTPILEDGTNTRANTGVALTEEYTLYKSLLEVQYPALDWNLSSLYKNEDCFDLRYYRHQQFRDYYGPKQSSRSWQTASRATKDAIAIANTLLECTDWFTTIARDCLTDMIHISDDADVHKAILTAFYVPLRWRYMYLQTININENEWPTFDLSAKSQQERVWDFVRTFVRDSVLTPTQRQASKRNTLEWLIKKLCKSTHLCKVLLNYGVPKSCANLTGMLITLHSQIKDFHKSSTDKPIAFTNHTNIAQEMTDLLSKINDTDF